MDDLTPEELEEHRSQRADNNFSTRDIWNFAWSNAEAQIKALTALRDMAHGYPAELATDEPLPDGSVDHSGMDRWREILDKMIDGWQSLSDEDELTIRPYDESKTFLENVNAPISDEQREAYRVAVDACRQRFTEGIELYVRYYRSLWD